MTEHADTDRDAGGAREGHGGDVDMATICSPRSSGLGPRCRPSRASGAVRWAIGATRMPISPTSWPPSCRRSPRKDSCTSSRCGSPVACSTSAPCSSMPPPASGASSPRSSGHSPARRSRLDRSSPTCDDTPSPPRSACSRKARTMTPTRPSARRAGAPSAHRTAGAHHSPPRPRPRQRSTRQAHEHRERLEAAAARGTEQLIAALVGVPAAVITALGGPRAVATLKAAAKEADAGNPAGLSGRLP